MTPLKKRISAGAVIGEGVRAYSVEKVTDEAIYLRGHSQSGRRGLPNGILRIFPCEIIEKILLGIENNQINLQDILRKTRKDNEEDDIFTELNLDYDTFFLGYDTTIHKLCEYCLSNPAKIHKLTPLPKPFIILAGISGTGKSRFVRQQAQLSGDGKDNYCLVAVRPDWHEPSDLLGYVSRIGGDAQYVATDFLKFLVKAWVSIAGTACHAQSMTYAPMADWTPYWLCLDEMNLAPVEQYFADYLAVLETRSWVGGAYACEPLLKAMALSELSAASQTSLRSSLGVAGAAHDGLWAYFVSNGIAVPPNLIVAGTVNMDETTHGFSPKVLDRAFTIDFGVFYPNVFDAFFVPTTENVTLGFPCLSSAKQQDLSHALADADGTRSIEFLKAVNDVLAGTPFELAYRALNELLIAVACFAPQDGRELQAVWG